MTTAIRKMRIDTELLRHILALPGNVAIVGASFEAALDGSCSAVSLHLFSLNPMPGEQYVAGEWESLPTKNRPDIVFKGFRAAD